MSIKREEERFDSDMLKQLNNNLIGKEVAEPGEDTAKKTGPTIRITGDSRDNRKKRPR